MLKPIQFLPLLCMCIFIGNIHYFYCWCYDVEYSGYLVEWWSWWWNGLLVFIVAYLFSLYFVIMVIIIWVLYFFSAFHIWRRNMLDSNAAIHFSSLKVWLLFLLRLIVYMALIIMIVIPYYEDFYNYTWIYFLQCQKSVISHVNWLVSS